MEICKQLVSICTVKSAITAYPGEGECSLTVTNRDYHGPELSSAKIQQDTPKKQQYQRLSLGYAAGWRVAV